MVGDENAGVKASPQRKNLKPLQLIRSETAQMRGLLRGTEDLPDVVVRSPSEVEDTSPTFTLQSERLCLRSYAPPTL
jgi:hypothetical protein